MEESRILLDKIRNVRYTFRLSESLPAADKRWEDEKPWLFETLAHNLPRETGKEAIFLLTSPVTH
jgi:hypothetical protein